MYKTPGGGSENEFGFGGRFLSREFAESVIHETHEAWEGLIKEKGQGATV